MARYTTRARTQITNKSNTLTSSQQRQNHRDNSLSHFAIALTTFPLFVSMCPLFLAYIYNHVIVLSFLTSSASTCASYLLSYLHISTHRFTWTHRHQATEQVGPQQIDRQTDKQTGQLIGKTRNIRKLESVVMLDDSQLRQVQAETELGRNELRLGVETRELDRHARKVNKLNNWKKIV